MLDVAAPPPPQPEPDREAAPGRHPDAAEIANLLTGAELAMNENRLTTPVDDNAYLRYLRVLALDPGNEMASRGITSIVERYLTWALGRAEAGDMRKARQYLTSASSVDDRHPGIESVGARISELSNASRDLHTLAAREVGARTSAAVRELQRLARLADERGALVIISARTDAEGRWMYQQMNQATPLRLRARLELASRPMIRMVF